MATPGLPGALQSLTTTPSYTVSAVPFTPEPSPTALLMKADDSVAYDTPIGFDFTFYGNSYSVVHVSSNGLVGFDRSIDFGAGGVIPSADDAPYNNMIAVAWTDLNSSVAGADIRYETQGTAPNRKFVLQFNNVPEFFSGPGHVTAQLVLAEGSNDITLYTASLDISGAGHEVTQGIENATGTEAAFVPGRVQAFLTLSNDAVRFSPAPVAVNQAPIITAPPSVTFNTASGVCTATGVVGSASATDDAPGVTVVGVRSDQIGLDAPYPKGVTTITWTATDAGSLDASADQTVKVVDNERPSITAPADVAAVNDFGSAYATVGPGNPASADNCGTVAISGIRTDGKAISAPYPVGSTTITWTATDPSGNAATATQHITVRDVSAPSIQVPANMTVDAVSPGGGPVSYSLVATDNVGISSVSCTIPSGGVFPVGSTNTRCSAFDAAGNSASAAFVVTVRGAKDQIANLMSYVSALGLPNGTANPLLSQLGSAYDAVAGLNTASACGNLDSFASMVVKKRSNIPSAESGQMLRDYRRIITVLGC